MREFYLIVIKTSMLYAINYHIMIILSNGFVEKCHKTLLNIKNMVKVMQKQVNLKKRQGRGIMKRFFVFVCMVLPLLTACTSNNKTEFTDTELMVICDAVDSEAEALIDGMDYEAVYGKSEDERKQTEHFLKLYNRLRDRSLKAYKMKKNTKIQVKGTISYIEELRTGEIYLHLGDPFSGNKSFTIPVICATTDQEFLNYQKGDSITIEGVFFKKGRKEEHLSDCQIVDES